MFFADLLQNNQDKKTIEKTCDDFATFISDCVKSLIDVYNVAVKKAEANKSNHQITVFLLARHAIESLDAVSVLVSKGCSNPCQPLLRSTLEATLGIFYILKEDTARRAFAYQIAHYHRRLSLYRKMDPATQAGQEFRKYFKDDPLVGSIIDDMSHIDVNRMAANVEALLQKPELQPIEDEWKKAKKKKSDPEWYSLFDGPSNLRELAKHVGLLFPGMYEFLYRYWSNEVHAGSAMNATGKKMGQQVIRPIRHPEELQQAVNLASSLGVFLCTKLLETFAPEKLDAFRVEYQQTLQPRSRALRGKTIINAPWRDDSGP
jgi:Family of unknown function (DUF5677)